MPSATSTRPPSYRKHKPTGQAVVTLNGKDHYLGRFNSPASKAEYDKLIGEWLACGRQLPDPDSGLTVNGVLVAYLHHAAVRYGAKSNELESTKLVARIVKELFGREPASEFGP